MRRASRLAAILQLALPIAGACIAPTGALAAAPVYAPDTRADAARRADVGVLLDSARLWRQRGRDDLSRAALLKLLSIAPGDRDALRRLTAIEIEANHLDEAARLLARLERAHPDAAETQELGELLATARSQGARVVRDRLHALDDAPPATSRIAGHARTRRPQAGRTQAAESPATSPPIDAVAATESPAMPAAALPESPDPAAVARERRAQADALLAQGKDADALEALQEAVRLDPLSAWARFDLARLQQRRRDPAAARETIDAGLAAAPDDAEMAYAAALYLAGIDADAAARATLARIGRGRWSEGMQRLDTRLQVSALLATARTRSANGDAAGARAALEEATALAGSNASVLVRAGWTAQSIGDYTRSRRYFDDATRAASASAAADEAAAARRGVDYLESLRQSFVTSGFEFNVKPGDPGISRFERRIVPVELRWALDYDRHVFAHADHLDLSAGRLDLTDFASVARYGQILAAGPPGPGGSQRPRASGVMPGVGYEGRYWRFDAGHLPGSFPVSYAVGGVRFEARARGIDWRVELARRPVTSTLISLAGARDPASGALWGGVHRTGLALGVSRNRSGHDAYARLGLYSLAGHNVAGNTEAELLAGYDWYEAARDTARLTLGTTLTVWRFTRNQRFETFGHGGYYSPQSYVALSLPAQWSGTRGAWAWRLRAAVAWSSTHEDDAPFYPTDANLQAAAAAQAATNGLGTTVYVGGHGGGFSVAASGSLECRVADAWTVGARFQLDRSEDYSPDTFSVWFRYRINDRGTLQGAPRAPQIYAYY
jgi:tetratricopeptide (TPR) repeat protein